MSVTAEELAGAIAVSLDTQFGMLFPEDAKPTTSDVELAASLLSLYEITPKS